jgi:hypothetical protein
MSRSDEILSQLVAVTRNTGPGFVLAWTRLGPDSFRLNATAQNFSKVWANAVLQQVHPGADIDALFPLQRSPVKPDRPLVSRPTVQDVVKPAGTLTPRQWRSIADADAAAEGRRRRR